MGLPGNSATASKLTSIDIDEGARAEIQQALIQGLEITLLYTCQLQWQAVSHIKSNLAPYLITEVISFEARSAFKFLSNARGDLCR